MSTEKVDRQSRTPVRPLVLDDDDIIEHVRGRIAAVAPSHVGTKVVGFFDLVASTSAKLHLGSAAAGRQAIDFVTMATAIVERCDGVVISVPGDAVVALWDSPEDALRAAFTIRHHALRDGTRSRFALTIGQVDIRYDGARPSALGAAIDRAARIQAAAAPNQLLVDGALYEVVRSHLVNHREAIVGDPFRIDLKGIGFTQIVEISTSASGLVGHTSFPFEVLADGRAPLEHKVRFMRDAATSVTQVGIGLTTFAGYFTAHKPSEFRSHVDMLLRRGVEFRCYVMDPGYQPGIAWLRSRGESDYLRRIRESIKTISSQAKVFQSLGYPGELRLLKYRLVPAFHALVVDAADP